MPIEAAPAGVCPFPHEQMAAAAAAPPPPPLRTQVQAPPPRTQSIPPPPPRAQSPPPPPPRSPPTSTSIPSNAQSILEQAKQKAYEAMRRQQEAIEEEQRQLNLVTSDVAKKLYPAAQELEGETEEDQELIDLLEGITLSPNTKKSYSSNVKSSASAAAPRQSSPPPPPQPKAVSIPAPSPRPIPTPRQPPPPPPPKPISTPNPISLESNMYLAQQADTQTFLEDTLSPPPSLLVELMQRTDKGLTSTPSSTDEKDEVWETDYMLLAEEVERWLAQEEAKRPKK